MRPTYPFTLLLLTLPILIFFMTRGVVTHDEGYILSSAEKLLEGSIPYRDFDFVYTPASLFFTAISFAVFKTSILSSRILMIGIALASSYLIYQIIFISTRNKLYSTLSLLLFVAWGPTHINFSWPVMYSLFTGLLVCYFFILNLITNKTLFLPLAGVASFAVFLTKQNFGAAILLTSLAFLLFQKNRSLNNSIHYILGYIWGINLFGAYLLSTSSFLSFFENMYFYTYQWIIVKGSLTTPFIFPDTLLKMIARTFIYLLPLVVSVISVTLLIIRKRFYLLFLPIFTASFYLLSIRPTTDYVHLTPLLALTGIPIALFLRYNIATSLRYVFFLLSFGLIIAGFYTSLFKGYYRWNSPLISHHSFFAHERVNIFMDAKTKKDFSGIISATNAYSEPDDYLYVDSYSPLLYFITDRKEPTKKTHLGIEVNTQKHYNEVIGNLIAKEVKIIITNQVNPQLLPIGNYLLQNYRRYKSVQDFIIYIRKP